MRVQVKKQIEEGAGSVILLIRFSNGYLFEPKFSMLAIQRFEVLYVLQGASSDVFLW